MFFLDIFKQNFRQNLTNFDTTKASEKTIETFGTICLTGEKIIPSPFHGTKRSRRHTSGYHLNNNTSRQRNPNKTLEVPDPPTGKTSFADPQGKKEATNHRSIGNRQVQPTVGHCDAKACGASIISGVGWPRPRPPKSKHINSGFVSGCIQGADGGTPASLPLHGKSARFPPDTHPYVAQPSLLIVPANGNVIGEMHTRLPDNHSTPHQSIHYAHLEQRETQLETCYPQQLSYILNYKNHWKSFGTLFSSFQLHFQGLSNRTTNFTN